MTTTIPECLLPIQAVIVRVGLSKASIARRIKAGTFPDKLQVDGNPFVVRWRASEIDAWIAGQDARDKARRAR